ncbi:DUF6507 family protein [Nocardiopsis deserti]|uniref:DUF6507 family protein n=1 Tax=Nocardiopsis deserti TaxID=2605988 RepID=UPI001238AE55|nr:DUF6507 family protein [Nocardiopsis deserti]
MTSWNIQPAEVGGVLTAVVGHMGEEGGGEGLIGAANGFGQYLFLCFESSNSGPVQTSLEEFGAHHLGLIGDMAALASSAVQGASQATMAYINSQTDMASQYEAAAGVVPEPEDPTAGHSEPL